TPEELKNEVNSEPFDRIDYYFAMRNLLIHNNGVVNDKAVRRCSKFIRDEQIGFTFNLKRNKFEEIFKLLSSVGCEFSNVVDKISFS
ncbi:MAG: hypothetical protein K0Q65_1782, partial [Clostridia bacterium]|nr:hypothetical protein [Clostridia bacterium]